MMRTIKNLIGAALIAIAAFIFWVVILPDYEKMDYLQTVIESRSILFETKNKLIEKAEALDLEYQSKYAELKRLSLVVPAKDHVEEIITIIQDMFSRTGVPLSEMTLSVQKESDLPYNSVGMKFNFISTYESILGFLNTMEHSIRLIDPSKMTIGINEEAKSQGALLDVEILAESYFVNPKDEATADRPAQAISDE